MSDDVVRPNPPSSTQASDAPRLAQINRQARWALLAALIALGVVSAITAVVVSAVAPPLVAEVAERRKPPTRTPTSAPAPTATPAPTSTPDAARQAAEARAARVMSDTTPVRGPVSGRLLQTSTDDVPIFAAYVDVRDFVAEAVFVNPDATTLDAWDYGFIFRASRSNLDYRFSLNAQGQWSLQLVRPRVTSPDGPLFTVLQRGWLPAPDFNLSALAANHVRLIVSADVVYVYVNGQFIAQAPVAEIQRGDVYAATSLWTENSVPGRYVRFRDFTVWELP